MTDNLPRVEIVEQSVSLTELEGKCQISRPTLRKYLQLLGIEPERLSDAAGRTAFVSQEDSEWVAALKATLAKEDVKTPADAIRILRSQGLPAKYASFNEGSGTKPMSKKSQKLSSEIDFLEDNLVPSRSWQGFLSPLVNPLAELVVTAKNVLDRLDKDPNFAASSPAPSPPPVQNLNHYEELEKAAKNGWLLSTSELAGLLRISPNSLSKNFERGVFKFVKLKKKIGRESAWRVEKIDLADLDES